jgi:tetratricopeptide (TPR) repeat protein
LLAKDWRQPELWAGYVDAAASATSLPPGPHKPLLLRVADQSLSTNDAVRLARLGWIMRRLGEQRKGLVFLRRALELSPQSRQIRRDLADALQAAGEYDEAERHYQHLLRSSARK